MLMSAIASPRLGMGPLIRVKTSVSSVMLSSRKRSCCAAGWCGRQIALKPCPFHVPSRPASAPRGSAAPPVCGESATVSTAGASGVSSPANAKPGSVCATALMMFPASLM